MPFLRKIANKLVEMKSKNQEILNFLESIPEWEEYYSENLKKINTLESTPLASDPRKKQVEEEDSFDIFLKLKDFQPRSSKQSSMEEGNNDDNEEEEDVMVE